MSEYRTGECPVVDLVSGRIDYGPPRPDDVEPLMKALVQWHASEQTARLPGPIRAGIMAYQFVTIYPFFDGNGRTARALATAELWRSGYRMRGFLSMEEYYYEQMQRYYDSLQMGLDVDYYRGRNDADLTSWLSYFIQMMRQAAQSVSQRALELWEHEGGLHQPPWEALDRRQQQVLMRWSWHNPSRWMCPASRRPMSPNGLVFRRVRRATGWVGGTATASANPPAAPGVSRHGR